MTGPTGCGKSSTLAALVDLVNTHRHDHVVTIEDPVEFLHSNRQSIIEQIEVGRDAPDFAGSLRSILRQNPDVILVGEMRDPETIATVLTAAETGHLVLSTLHTNDTSQAVSRILDSFPAANQAQIRQQFSLALLAVVAQQLVPAQSIQAGDRATRYPAVEILMGSSGVRSLIRKGEDHQLYSAISTGRGEGMITMEQSLAEMVRNGRISRDTAMRTLFPPRGAAALPEGMSSSRRISGTRALWDSVRVPPPERRRRAAVHFAIKDGVFAHFMTVKLPILATVFLHHGPIQRNPREDAMRARPRQDLSMQGGIRVGR